MTVWSDGPGWMIRGRQSDGQKKMIGWIDRRMDGQTNGQALSDTYQYEHFQWYEIQRPRFHLCAFSVQSEWMSCDSPTQ